MPANWPASRAMRLSSQLPPLVATASDRALTRPGRSGPTTVRISEAMGKLLNAGLFPAYRLLTLQASPTLPAKRAQPSYSRTLLQMATLHGCYAPLGGCVPN